jgi:hypothetical protein
MSTPIWLGRCCVLVSAVQTRIAAGVSLLYLARLMGSSVAQIDKTYAHMLPDSEDYLRGLLDAFDVAKPDAAERFGVWLASNETL